MGLWSFRLLGFTVIVEPWFWLVTLLLGAERPPELVLSWMIAVFVSILAHELGHAYMGRLYGYDASIRLYSLGGLTSYKGGPRRVTLLQEGLLSLAGPMAGFAFGLAIYLAARVLPFQGTFMRVFISDLLWVNIAWGLVNLLPVLPLDGGHVMRHTVYWWTGRSDDHLPLRISITAGALVAAVALTRNSLWIAAMFSFMAYQSYQLLQHLPRSRRA